MQTPTLILPGWQGSGPAHWQSRWERLHGDTRVEQHDWMRPLRGDWTARLEEVVLSQPGPVLVAAHSLGCILAAWWAAHSRHSHKIQGALLVAPPDIERDDNRQMIPGWAPVVRAPLPFRSIVVASSDDPFCDLAVASQLASQWQSALYHIGARGHVNADSGLGDWPEGRALLASLASSGVQEQGAGQRP